MAEDITIKLEERTQLRKGLKKLRDSGLVPAVIHNYGQESVHVMGDYTALDKAFNMAGKHHPVQLKVGNKQQLALIKNVDFEPTKNRLRHIVFQSIKQNEKTTAEIPVVFEGEEIPAEKKGLLILTQLDVVEVEALPKDLPDELKVDATVLENEGDRLHVSDIKVPDGVTVLTDSEQGIAIVEMPRDQVAEADAAAANLAEDAQSDSEVTTDQEETQESEGSQDEETASEQ